MSIALDVWATSLSSESQAGKLRSKASPPEAHDDPKEPTEVQSSAHQSQRGLLVLDVDGTVSRIFREEERSLHQNESGWRSWMSVDDDVVDALDALVERTEIDVAWLTTWPHDQVAWLIQEPLRGKLSGPYVPWQNWPKQGWRLQSLISYVRDAKPSAVAWADDRAPEDAARRLTGMTEVPSFVMRPNKHVGLTLEAVDRIAAVLERTDQNR